MQRLPSSPLVYVVWLLFCAAILRTLWTNVQRVRQSQQRLHVVEQENQELKKTNEELLSSIQLAKDPFIREQSIREHLGMQKANEVVVFLPGTELNIASPSSDFFLRTFGGKTTPTPAPIPPYKQWFQLFFTQENDTISPSQ